MKLIPVPAEIANRMSERLAVLGSTVECIKETLFGTLSDRGKAAEISGEALIGVIHEIQAIHSDLDACAWDKIGAPTDGVFTDASADRVPYKDFPPALACGFCCGTDDIHVVKRTAPNGEPYFRVACGQCTAEMGFADTPKEAAESWNERNQFRESQP